MVSHAAAKPLPTDHAPSAISPHGPLLFSSDNLVVRLRGILAGDTSPNWTPITGATRAEVKEDRGPVAYLYGGWTLSLAGAALALGYPGGNLGLFAGLVTAFAGSHLVHRHLERCTTRLVVSNGGTAHEVESRVRKLGDDTQALYLAKQAVDHAAALLHTTSILQAEVPDLRHGTAPSEPGCPAQHVAC